MVFKGYKFSESHNKKISESRKGIKFSVEHKKNISKSKIGKKHSEEHKRKIGLKSKGRTYTKEQRKRRSEDSKGAGNPNWKGILAIRSIKRYRSLVEKEIGRFLLPTEVVHHINGITGDDRIENLIAFINQGCHNRFGSDESKVYDYEIIFDGRKLSKEWIKL